MILMMSLPQLLTRCLFSPEIFPKSWTFLGLCRMISNNGISPNTGKPSSEERCFHATSFLASPSSNSGPLNCKRFGSAFGSRGFSAMTWRTSSPCSSMKSSPRPAMQDNAIDVLGRWNTSSYKAVTGPGRLRSQLLFRSFLNKASSSKNNSVVLSSIAFNRWLSSHSSAVYGPFFFFKKTGRPSNSCSAAFFALRCAESLLRTSISMVSCCISRRLLRCGPTSFSFACFFARFFASSTSASSTNTRDSSANAWSTSRLASSASLALNSRSSGGRSGSGPPLVNARGIERYRGST
mmetsp:Transcript_1614/g.4751  ORF Transcript_1614/g.4751 Transcript_1614/m.4751 type:complete len:294 (-) Transcript_1614:1935-2816(-)